MRKTKPEHATRPGLPSSGSWIGIIEVIGDIDSSRRRRID